ncbi:TrmH family RNA methyltransferase [Paenibacillus roseipurpureus]|uniref:RNA methyltransferase n=1 Tax=Paenibacillus roseopurpureus TaxID=2918901 RepID=A0AA96LQS8_9BACL|nr:RNA methyltransferase [Paenibacillus sp. MBLB1832]WNR45537.1 RNA methyltransferase [Paenibacillus sp. MBLB1832]
MTNFIEIMSVQNARVKDWAQLLERRGREKQGKYIIEGYHLIEEALKAGAGVEVILFLLEKGYPTALASLAGEAVEWVGVSAAVLAKCSDAQTPQGVVAIVARPQLGVDELLASEYDLAVVLDGVQDPGNLGTIIRSADAVGAKAVVLGRGTVDLYNPKTIRSTMGSMYHLPIVEADLVELLPRARERGVRLVTTSLQAQGSCYDTDLRQPTWLIFGNEAKGVSAEVAALSDVQVIIPMQGKAESLNVAMAATVLLFEAARQRRV